MADLRLTGMDDALIAAFWLGIFIAGRAALRAGRSRHYVRCAGFGILIVALLWGGLFVGLTPGASAYARHRFSCRLFGRGFALGAPRHSYHSARDTNGDGYSIDVYETPEALVRWAASPPSEWFARYPVPSPFRSHWPMVSWRRTPVGVNELRFLEFALLEQTGTADLAAARGLLERLAKEPGHFFACCFLMHRDRVGDVDFFLFSPVERVLIAVRHNT